MKDIKEYEGLYAVTSCGRIWSYRSKKFLKNQLDRYGYEYVNLKFQGKCKKEKIHRLVAEAYIPNPDNLPQVNHKDEVRNHNWVGNLEWCSAKYNTLYSQSKKVECIETGEIFESITDAANSINRHKGNLSKCLKGKTKTCAGYHWQYAEESELND